MAPKKQKKKEVIQEIDKVCQHYYRGYCYQKDDCDERHHDKVCEDPPCDEQSCEKRHPNPCNFGFRCKFKKKTICLYSHVTFVGEHDNKTEDLKKRLCIVEKENKPSLLPTKNFSTRWNKNFNL